MPPWLPKVLSRVRALAAGCRVRFTLKALRELAALELGLDPTDACDVLMCLVPGDSAGRIVSKSTGEWLYVFEPRIADSRVHVKLLIRADCWVVSFHEDEGGHEENG
jgi:hypothetical protein